MKNTKKITILVFLTLSLTACTLSAPNAKIDANVDQSTQKGNSSNSNTSSNGQDGQPQQIVVNINNNPNINTNVNPNISNSSSNSSTTNNSNANNQTNAPNTNSPDTSNTNIPSGSSSSDSNGSEAVKYEILYIQRDANSKNPIYSANLDGSLKRKLIEGEINQNNSFPVSSPDGTKVAYNSLYNLFVMNKDGTSNLPILKTQLFGPSGTPSWTSDGKQLYYQDQNSIYVINADGTQKSKVYQPSGAVYFSRVSPDGKTLAFILSADGKPVLTTVGVNGIGETQITDNSKILLDTSSNISWTNDGKSIIFSAYQPEEAHKALDRNTDIYQINIDGTGLIKLTDNPGKDNYPSLSSDGKMIVFESKREEGEGIFSMTSDGKNQQIVINNYYAVQPSFISKDDQKNISPSSLPSPVVSP